MQKPYEHKPFPSVRYHRLGEKRLVHTPAEHDDLMAEGDWADTPAAFPPAVAPTVCASCGQQLSAPAQPEPTEDAVAEPTEDAAAEPKKKNTRKKA